MLHRTFTNRYEVKYFVHVSELAALQENLNGIMVLDDRADGLNGYYNYSVYFDTSDFRFYHEKHEGQLKRMKPRLRVHIPTQDALPDKWFFEFKGRYGQIIHKRRCEIAEIQAQELLRGNINLFSDDGEHDILNEFHVASRKLDLRPTVAVLYNRIPYNSHLFPGLRITLDTRMQCGLSFKLGEDQSDLDYFVPPNIALVELKYTDSLPMSVLHILHKFEMRQVTFSKYTNSLDAAYSNIG
jgi:hypothetical protein